MKAACATLLWGIDAEELHRLTDESEKTGPGDDADRWQQLYDAFDDLRTAWRDDGFVAMARRWLDPDAVLAARKSIIARFIARHASGNHLRSGPFVDALVDGLRHTPQSLAPCTGPRAISPSSRPREPSPTDGSVARASSGG